MSGELKKDVPFTLKEIRIFTALAMILAMIATAIGFVSRSEIGHLLAVAMATVMMVVVPLVIYVMRRRKSAK